jgi:hypothetical protein
MIDVAGNTTRFSSWARTLVTRWFPGLSRAWTEANRQKAWGNLPKLSAAIIDWEADVVSTLTDLSLASGDNLNIGWSCFRGNDLHHRPSQWGVSPATFRSVSFCCLSIMDEAASRATAEQREQGHIPYAWFDAHRMLLGAIMALEFARDKGSQSSGMCFGGRK